MAGWILAAVLLAGGLTGCRGDEVTVRTYAAQEGASTEAKSARRTEQVGTGRSADGMAGDSADDMAGKAADGTSGDSADGTTAEVCVVYVCGAVKQEGVYTLPAGSRVADALKAAGGFSKKADRSVVNLAEKLSDGEKIRIPEEGETPAEDPTGNGGTGDSTETGININTADAAMLTQLPGIGETRARDIIDYREDQGAFSKPEDLMKVPGIKEGTYNKVKDRIRVR